MRAADHRIVDRRTQWHPLSAFIMNPMAWSAQEGPSSMLWVSADDNIVVTVDGEVVVGRRRRRPVELACTGLTHKARAALSGLSGRRHGRWCRVRAPSSGRRSGPSDFFQWPYVT